MASKICKAAGCRGLRCPVGRSSTPTRSRSHLATGITPVCPTPLGLDSQARVREKVGQQLCDRRTSKCSLEDSKVDLNLDLIPTPALGVAAKSIRGLRGMSFIPLKVLSRPHCAPFGPSLFNERVVLFPENKPKGAEWNNQPSAYGFDQRSAEPMQQQQQQPWSQPPPDNSGMLWNGNKDGGQQESWGPGGGQQNQPGPNSWDAPGGHNPYGHGGMGMGNQMQGGMPVST